MPRARRVTPGGIVYHVLNRGVGRSRLFFKDADYRAFEQIMVETLESCPMRICSYVLMPNHWHLLLWPKEDGELAAFMQRLTITHVTRWQRHRGRVGDGHLYQGRYKSFPVENDEYFYQAARYIERNAVRASLVEEADQWQWSSLWRYYHGTVDEKSLLAPWPVDRPRQWRRHVQRPLTDAELDAVRRCVVRGCPLGGDLWTERIVNRLGLEFTLRKRGRPKKVVRHVQTSNATSRRRAYCRRTSRGVR